MLRPTDEIYFWSGIMHDHAEFFLTSLSSRETEFIRSAQYFKSAFMSINQEAQALSGSPNMQQIAAFANKVISVLANFISFKRLAMQRLLTCNIELAFPPTFINHMINEAMEFYRAVCTSLSNMQKDPTAENIQLHKIWLPDASGHAASIASDLDPTEYLLIKEAKEFKKVFDNLFIKATELGKMLERTCLDDGALDLLNAEVEKKITEFICYLEKIKALRLQCKAMGTIKPLIPDHMIREEKYYLSKIG